MTKLETLLSYVNDGLSIIPIQPGGKKPLIPWQEFQQRRATESEVKAWLDKWPDMNVAVVTGRISGITVVDVDDKEFHEEMRDQIISVVTPRGYHYYYRYSPTVQNKVGISSKIDIRNDGGYCLLPPSEGYEWSDSDDLNFRDDPTMLVQLPDVFTKREQALKVNSTEKLYYGPDENNRMKEGGRNNMLTSLAGSMRRRGMSYDAILAALLTENDLRCHPPLPQKEVETIASSVSRYEPEDSPNGNIEANRIADGTGGSRVVVVPEPPRLMTYTELKGMEFEPVETIPTKIKCLDEYFDGGLGLKELSLVIAEQETGKSTLACWIGSQAKLAGYNVLHTFYEDQPSNIKQRYENHLAIDHSETEVFFADGTRKALSLDQIEAAIKECNPGLVIIDYMARVPILAKMAESRFESRDILMRFANMARSHNCHIMVLDHVLIVDRKWMGPPPECYRMTLGRVSEAKMYKLMIVDLMIGMIRDYDDPAKLWITGMKNKRKNRRMFAPIHVDYATGRFNG